MRKILITILSLLTFNCFASDFYSDVKFYANSATVVNIGDTTVTGTWNGGGAIFRITGKISGTCTLTNCIIEANSFTQIFDTTVTIGAGVSIREFSAQWYGAKPSLTDNYAPLQYALNACFDRYNLYVPAGQYNFSKTLFVGQSYLGTWIGTTLRMYGDANFWAPEKGTILHYTGNSSPYIALALQLNKGTEIDHINITGNFVSPSGTDSSYYALTLSQFQDQSSNHYDSINYRGIAIDPYSNGDGSNSGSTGIILHDMNINNFSVLICMTRQSAIQNEECMIWHNIHFGDARIGLLSSQAQEKGNIIRNLYSWGSIHTILSSGNTLSFSGGGYTIDGGNIAGRPIRLLDINQQGWSQINVSNLFIESLGTIGNVFTGTTLMIHNCTFDFAYPNTIGYKILANTNSQNTLFLNCLFRYFGSPQYAMNFLGTASFINCGWTGTYVNAAGGRYQVTLPSGVRAVL